ncbi:E3 ubiquitin-protein ligase XIAP [Callorhinchus milii]|uniref:E3 ubiquitin-protein ligase XIAP n=1 Tax=Callorhinchus milii TaxID=7868 RepID=A0A4W3JFT0_CALMI|nr:E3 ubiquitin-protein ligase XIAP [Callorhinchus milii]XP_042196628.1 E3 ubiquitin-protein ligase XIAP [Callorhinchus milii]|eukprot:gi/632935932/ref/XP_007891778.1/ PREDICTED: E3 ubiquitin-protein ligase XIAP [Callorhinchus milii]
MDITTDCQQDLSNEMYRLGTFINFPSDVPISERTLARAGFIYAGVKDQVRCFSCGGMIENWQHGDSAVGKHRQLFPACEFINGSWLNSEQMPTTYAEGHQLLENGTPRYINRQLNNLSSPIDDAVRTKSIEDMSHLRPRNPDMCNEEDRMNTFSNWPSYGIVAPRELAKAGLYYTSNNDQVQCFSCGGLMQNWEPGDRAMLEHKRHYPMCSFVLGYDVGNIPHEQNSCTAGAIHPSSNNEPRANFSSFPRHPDKQTFDARLETFRSSAGYFHNVEDFARAGFYSTGDGDSVKCFYCDGGLRNWESGDDIWEQHAKWFPGCDFLIHHKGQVFVNEVQLKKLFNSTTGVLPEDYLSKPEPEDRLMTTAAVQGALGMGFDRSLVKELVKKKFQAMGDNYTSVQALVADLLIAEKGGTQDVEQGDKPNKSISMEDQLKKLKEEKCCKVCWERDVSIAFVPCGHVATCKECSVAVSSCPICCVKIQEKVRIYMS